MIITITGPRSVGKSTISKLVARKLRMKWVSSDEIGEKAMKKHGGLDKAIKSGVIKKFIKGSAYSLIRAEYKKDNFVFDLSGGSITSEKFPEASEKVRKITVKKSIVVGLLPYKDEKKSIKHLFSREQKRKHFKGMDKKELMEKTKRSYPRFPRVFKDICDFVVYTEKRKPKEIAEEIVKKIEICKQ